MTGRPFDPNESDFVSISTGTLAPPDVARHILDGQQIGTEAYEEFKWDRLVDNIPNAQFRDQEEAAAQGCSQISERRLLQATETMSLYRLAGIYMLTWSWWERTAISGWAMSFLSHSGHSLGRSLMETGHWERWTKLLWPGRSRSYQQKRSVILLIP